MTHQEWITSVADDIWARTQRAAMSATSQHVKAYYVYPVGNRGEPGAQPPCVIVTAFPENPPTDRTCEILRPGRHGDRLDTMTRPQLAYRIADILNKVPSPAYW